MYDFTVEPTRRVVVDTNMIVASPRLNSGAWRALLSAARSGQVSIYVPEVCLIEVEGWMQREARIRLDRYIKAAQQMEHIGVRQGGFDDSSELVERRTSETVASYDRYLRDRLDGLATILPVPAVPHEALVHRAAARRLPFTDKGTGYRDALIWESVLALATEGPVTLLTANVKDFAKDEDLADDLKQDLTLRSIPTDRVRLATDLAQLVQELLPKGYDVGPEAASALNSTNGRSCLDEAINLAFGQNGSLPYPTTDGLPPMFQSPETEGAWDISDVAIDEARPVEDNSYFIIGTLHATSRIYDIIPESTWENFGEEDQASVDDVWDRGSGEVTVVVYRPVILTFAGTFTPPDTIWNVGALDVCLPSDKT